MAIVLYKPGNSKKVRGIPCDILICDEYSYLHNLEQGYFYSPEECYAEKEDEETGLEAAEQETEDEAKAETTGPVLSDDKIRTAAKEAGISHWHTKSIDRLIKELKELDDGE